jgi:hypothetical protein
VEVARLLHEIGACWRDLPDAVLDAGSPRALERLRRVGELDLTLRRMSTPHVGLLVNLAVGCLAEDECYLNVGLWQGYSFLSGVIGNEAKRCIGNDDFSMYVGGTGWNGPDARQRDFGDPRSIFRAELARVGGPRTEFVEGDCWELLRRWGRDGRPAIGFYFYDGDHGYDAQLRALTAALPHLSPECAILVDDTNLSAVASANRDFLRKHPDFELLLSLPTPANHWPTWWNGIELLGRTRARGARAGV